MAGRRPTTTSGTSGATGSAAPEATDVLGRVTLVTGKEEFLRERTVSAVRAAVRRHDPDSELSESGGAELTLATLGEMAAPSLFSAVRCVVVRSLENLPEESVPGLLEYAGAPVEDVALVLVHGGGPKGSGVLTRLRKLSTVWESKAGELKAQDFPLFVAAEVRSHGSGIDQDAAQALVQAVGQDLRALASAAHQLTHDFPGARLDATRVGQYFGGRAEGKSFTVADAAFAGRRELALEELRWAIDAGTAPVLVTSAFAGSARALARYLGADTRQREADLAREVGVPPWKLRTLREQSRSWSEDGLERAIRSVARADADVKGAAGDPAYTLERLVLTVAGLRESR